MKAYKAFNQDWTCRDFQYKVGETYTFSRTPKLCYQGFHACTNPADCFDYYTFTPSTRFAEVELSGELDGPKTGCSKVASSIITIVREIPWTEILQLINLGIANTGRRNSGNQNSGDWNSGNRNSGDQNSGDQNSGDQNSGDWNSGDWNSGNQNSGNRNSGNRNSGYWNSGDQNSGDWNSGDWNSGNQNSGNRNSGNRNSGYWNSGSWNSGNRNSGNWNSGNRNSGDWNSGDWNSGDWNSGYFNTETPTDILIFNKPCSKTNWELAEKPKFLYFRTAQWIKLSDMTEKELEEHPTAETQQGYFKTLNYKEAWQQSWNNAPNDDKQLLYKLPNFNPEVFKEISGIDVTKDPTWPTE